MIVSNYYFRLFGEQPLFLSGKKDYNENVNEAALRRKLQEGYIWKVLNRSMKS